MSRWSARSMVLAVGAALVAGCASGPPLKEIPTGQALAPMPQPERVVGYRSVSLRAGKELVSTLVAQTAETQTWMDSDGCRVVLPRTGFGPALEFTNCEGATGTQSVSLKSGSPYPLTPGSKWVYAYSGSNTRGDRWTGQRHCEVQGTAQVAVNGAQHDTYKVLCEDTAGATVTTRTFYVSPALEATVFQERYRVRHWAGAPAPDRTTWEFVSQEPAPVSRDAAAPTSVTR